MASTMNDLRFSFFKGMAESQSASGAITTRDAIARAVEDGKLYSAIITEPAVAAGSFFDVGVRLSGGLPMGIQSLLLTAQTSILRFELYEDSTWSGGADVPEFNSNRLFPDPDPDKNTELFKNPTVTDLGNLIILYDYLGADNGGNVGDFVQSRTSTPLVLNPAYDYILRIINVSGSTGDIESALIYVDR